MRGAREARKRECWGARASGSWALARRAGGRAERAAGRWLGAQAGVRNGQLALAGRASGTAGRAGHAGSWALGARAAGHSRPGRGLGAGRAAWAPGLAGAVHLVHSAVFGPVRLSIFLSQIFWTLFVNPVHEHCSSRNFSKKKKKFKFK